MGKREASVVPLLRDFPSGTTSEQVNSSSSGHENERGQYEEDVDSSYGNSTDDCSCIRTERCESERASGQFRRQRRYAAWHYQHGHGSRSSDIEYSTRGAARCGITDRQ
jgi:hypothetical protein